MTQAYPPYQPPHQPPVGPAKPRPHWAWFLLGGLLLVSSVLVFVAALLLTLLPLFEEDAVFAADGQPHTVELADDDQRAVFVRQGEAASCEAVDDDGAQVSFAVPNGSFTVNSWEAVRTFDAGSGEVEFRCESAMAGSEVRIGKIPSVGGVFAGIAIAILLPLLLGIAGLVTLIVTGILWARRPPRPKA